MHPVVADNLEEYLADALPPAAQRAVKAHLASCGACRDEVRSMREVSSLFECFRPVEAVEPGPDFIARVMEQVIRQPAASIWASLYGGFARRIVFASLVTLAVLGGYLVSRESEYSPGPASPEAVMAADQPGPAGAPNDRDRMLVTLTAYEP